MSRVKLRILATSDLHAHLLDFDYERDVPRYGEGLQSLLPVIAELRSDADISFLLDNGDLLNGCVLADLFSDDPIPEENPHPIIEMLNAVGYDAIGLGNHDFNFGIEHLTWAIKSARFPVISTNIKCGITGGVPPGLCDEHIFTRKIGDHELTIGVISAAPPEILSWDHDLYEGMLIIEPIVNAVTKTAQSLRDRGVDVIVALCHSGIGHPLDTLQENVGHIVAQSGLIDALILGHQHHFFPDPATPNVHSLQGTPTVMPGSFGSHLGVIDLDLDRDATKWNIAGFDAKLVAASAKPVPEPQGIPNLRRNHERARELLAKEICHHWPACHGFFAELGHDPISNIFAQSQIAWLKRNVAEHVTAPLLCSYAPLHAERFGQKYASTAFESGILRHRDIFALAPLFNRLALVEMTGKQVIEYLERSASYFGTLHSAELTQDIALYNFEVVHGLSYDIALDRAPRYDISGKLIDPARRRVINIRTETHALEGHDKFQLITSHFRAGGGGNFPFMDGQDTQVFDVSTREALIEYVQSIDAIPIEPPNWRLVAPQGAQWRYTTDPMAEAYLHEIAHFDPQIINRSENYLELKLQF